MTSESDFWATVRRALSPYGRLQRIESHLTARGIPDVIYSLLGHAGWLELKYVAEWPKRPTTPLHVKHLKLEQVLFLEDWERHPSYGQAHSLLRVADDYLLLDPALTRKLFDRVALKEELIQGAVVHGRGSFPTNAIIKSLTAPLSGLPGARRVVMG